MRALIGVHRLLTVSEAECQRSADRLQMLPRLQVLHVHVPGGSRCQHRGARSDLQLTWTVFCN